MRKILTLLLGLSTTAALAQELRSGVNPEQLDPAVSPCDNFYQFAAGGWMKANPMPETESRWGSFNVLAKQNDAKIKLILDGLVQAKTPAAKGSTEQLVGDFYRSALDTQALEKR